MTATDEILEIFGRRGAGAYFGECVTLTEHALQAAYFAQSAGGPPALVVAALLHDIGHLVADVPDDIDDWVDDAHHENVGGAWLAARFPAAVYQPVRLHVPAKRYLCATDTGYLSRLSAASVVTLKLQGGPMSAAEIACFEAQSHHRDAVSVRRWDDQGKIAALATPGLRDYRALIEALALRTP